MKIKLFYGVIVACLFITLTSCSNDDSFQGENLTNIENFQLNESFESLKEGDSIPGDPLNPKPKG